MEKFRKVIEMDRQLKRDLSVLAGYREMSLNEYINMVLYKHSKNTKK